MATLDDLAWMAGHWGGDGFGGQVEETWSAPLGDTILGMFRLVQDGATRVIEFETITAEADGIVLRFKHFDPQLETREDQPITMRLIQAAGTEAVFESPTRIEGHPRRIIYSASPDGQTLRSRVEGWDLGEDGQPKAFGLEKQRIG